MILMHSFPAAQPEQTVFSGIIDRRDDHTELAAAMFVRKLHIRPHLKGYSYLITAIVLGLHHPQLMQSLTNRLYPAVAEVYRTTASAVERNIRSAIDLAFSNDADQLQALFHYRTRKPYISEVLALALETIRFGQLADGGFSHQPEQGSRQTRSRTYP